MGKDQPQQKLSLFADHWSPKIVGELNEQQVKLAKVQGEFVCTAMRMKTSSF